MSLFGKKPEPQPIMQPRAPGDEPATPNRSYGVAVLIRLLKTIPVDQHPDLVVRVVKTTLESVGVHSSHVRQGEPRSPPSSGSGASLRTQSPTFAEQASSSSPVPTGC